MLGTCNVDEIDPGVEKELWGAARDRHAHELCWSGEVSWFLNGIEKPQPIRSYAFYHFVIRPGDQWISGGLVDRLLEDVQTPVAVRGKNLGFAVRKPGAGVVIAFVECQTA